MSLIFMDGYDDGLQSNKWSSWNAAVSATLPRTGARSGDYTANDARSVFALSSGQADATIIIGMAFKGDTPGNVSNDTRRHLALFGDAGATRHLTFVFRNSVGAVEVYRDATLVVSSAPGAVAANTWLFIEVKAFLADVNGTVVVKINGSTVVNFTGDTRNAGTVVKFDRVQLGFASNFDSSNMRVDDFYVLNTAGTVNNNFIGDCSIQTRYPDGNGNYSQGINSGSTSVNNYTYVDENPDPNTSDYVAFATTGNKDTYTFADIPGGTVYGVQQAMYAAKSDTGSRTARNIQRIAGVDYASAVDQGLSVTPSYLGKFDIMETSPATGLLWTVTEVNGTEFGTEARA